MKNKFIILFLFIFLFTGCKNYKDLEQIGLVYGLQVSVNDNKYQFLFEFLTPKEEDIFKSEKYQVQCKKINDCIQELYLSSNKKIYLEHLELLVLSDNITKEHLKELTSFFLTRNDARTNFSVVVQNDSVNKKDYNLKSILNLLEVNMEEVGMVSIVSFDEIVQILLKEEELYLPYISLKEDENMVLGMIEVSSLNKILSTDNSIIYNFIKNNVKNVSFLIKENEFKVSDSLVVFSAKKDKIIVNVDSNIQVSSCSSNYSILQKQYEDFLSSALESFLRNHYSIYLNNFYKNRFPNQNSNSYSIEVLFDTKIKIIESEDFLCNTK